MFTFIFCSFKVYLLNMWMAFSAPLLEFMVTKENPFDSPFFRSVIRSASITSPT